MPIDPTQAMPDSVAISPQQQAVTQGIAASAAYGQQSAAPPTTPRQAPSSFLQDKAVPFLSNVLQGFAMARMGQDAVGQALRVKYAQQAQDKAFANQQALERARLANEAIMKGVMEHGSQFITPKLRKDLMKDPETFDHIDAMAKAVDKQNEISAQAAKALGLPEGAEHLPKQLLNAYYEQQRSKNEQAKSLIEQKTAQIRQDTAQAEGSVRQNIANVELQKANVESQKTNVELQKANVELQKAAQDKTDKAAEKQQEALGKWIDSIGKQRDALVQKYSGTKADGTPNFTDKQRAAAANAFNASIDAQAKRLHKAGMTDFDPEAYKVEADPTQPGSIWNWSKTEPGTLTAKVSDTAGAAPVAGAPTGPNAAAASIQPPPAGAVSRLKNKDGSLYGYKMKDGSVVKANAR